MLTLQNISKSYGLETILDNVSFTLDDGERLGLVGPNGCGKTTLLRIITAEEFPDSGTVKLAIPAERVGYLPQGFRFQADDTLGGYLNRLGGDMESLTVRLEQLAAALARQPDQPALQQEYDLTLAKLELAAEFESQLHTVLGGLGLADYPLDTPASILSGGQKTRLALAGVLLSSPQLLLLDEPTNHLDIEMLEWLEGWLRNFQHAVLLVSHDRAFLDNTVAGILEIDPATHSVRRYAGGYSDYQEQKAAERERCRQAYRDQQDEIVRLQKAAMNLRMLTRPQKGGKADSGDKFAKAFFANRSLHTIGRAKYLEARLDRLKNEDAIEKPRQMWEMKMEFGETPASGRDVVVMEDLAVGYNGIPLLENIRLTLRYGRRVALIGPNGSGKTTLLRTVAGLLLPLAGSVRLGSGVKAGYMAQEQENLDPALDALETMLAIRGGSETEARSFLSKYLFKGDDVFIPISRLSYGERARLSLACLVAQGCNLLLLDEPVNHLDIPSRGHFEQSLSGFEGTVLAVVHDRYFIEAFATEIWAVEGRTVRRAWGE